MRVLRQAAPGWSGASRSTPTTSAGGWTATPTSRRRRARTGSGRNADWRHVDAFDVLAMPDPWEYPWFAAWDLAFHASPWAHLDPAFAKYQLLVLLREWFLHPNGALPAYEWSFDDVNPPVHAWPPSGSSSSTAARDTDFLERVFQKLLLNFTWWVNRQDPDGNNVFGGGFLGLDNIGPVDRSQPARRSASSRQTARRGWRTTRLAMLELARDAGPHNHVYDDMVVKFLEHFVLIGDALDASGMLDADDGFFYDRLIDAARQRDAHPGAVAGRRAARCCRPTSITLADAERMPHPQQALRPPPRGDHRREGRGGRSMRRGRRARLLVSMVTPEQLRTGIATLFDEEAFLSPYGLRSLSKRHGRPYQVPGVPGAIIEYEPAESRTGMFGGNSNWRGPVWFRSTTWSSGRWCSTTSSSAPTSRSSTRPARACS